MAFKLEKKDGLFVKLTPGTHRLRALSPYIDGWVGWTAQTGGKPLRKRERGQFSYTEIYTDPEQFLAFKVWNYTTGRVQVFELSKWSLLEELSARMDDPDFGDIQGYDIEITRTGTGKTDTRYKLVAKPPKPIDPEIEKAGAAVKVNLEALFTGDDPFGGKETSGEKSFADELDEQYNNKLKGLDE